jgi:hypothetical protein
VLLLARTKDKLDEVKAEIEAEGGKASVFPCDLNDMESIDAVSKEILASVDHIDILINNAGRSIRRAVHESVDRFHDFERTMQLLKDHHPSEALTDDLMRQAYLKLEQGEERLKQLYLLDQLGKNLDKYMRSFMVYTAFKMCKGTANKYNFNVMYEFMQDGFLAMKPLKSAEKFVKDFTAVERQIIDKVHAGHLYPFQ